MKENDRCPQCIKLSRYAGEHPVGKLEIVKGTEPYDIDHLQCPICESTYIQEKDLFSDNEQV